MSNYSKSPTRTTVRFTFSNDVSDLLGNGTPYPMMALEDKLRGLRGVELAEVVSWGTPFRLDVTLSNELAASFNLNLDEVEDSVAYQIDGHCEDYQRLVRYGMTDGCFPSDQTLVVSDNDFIVLQNNVTQDFTIRYEADDGEIINGVVDDRDAISETIEELMDECSSVAGSVARGTTDFDDWISRHKRGIVWKML